MRLVCFSTYREPTLGYWLRELQNAGLGGEIAVVLDSKNPSDKDMVIWEERTEGRLQSIPLFRFDQVPFHFVDSHNDTQSASLLMKLQPDLILNCGTPRILKRDILEIPKTGVLNVHPGKLPEYRGCTVVEWALYNGDPVCNSAHLMTEAIDDGPIVIVEKVPVEPFDSYVDIRVKTQLAGCQLMAMAARTLLDDPRAAVAASGPGRYYKPIDDQKLATIKTKVGVV